jgi:hypothetical protein
MRKEILFAVLIGLGLGLIITYGVYTAARGPRPESPATSPLVANASASPATDSTELVLTNPPDETVQKESATTIAGTTWANSFVVILVNGKENITTADANGNFSVKSTLRSGANIIAVTALNEDGKQAVQERTVILADDAALTDEPSPTPSPTASPRASARPRTSPSPSPAQ